MIPTLEIDNPGMVLLGRPPRNAVVVITGLYRGGTTYVAQTLAAADVLPLFHKSGAPALEEYRNLEDPEAISAIESGDRRRFLVLLASRPQRWMFKCPNLDAHASFLRAVCGKRLAWVIVYRDLLAIAIREHRWTGRPIEEQLASSAQRAASLADFAAASHEPRCLVSYEKARQFPCQLKYHFSEWMKG